MFNIPTHMDYEGQGKAESWSRIIITVFGVIGLVVGGFLQQFSITVFILAAGFLLACLVTIPPWPIYRKKPLKWQKPREPSAAASTSDAASEETKSKKKK